MITPDDIKLLASAGERSAIQNSLHEISPHLACSLSMIEVEGKTVGVVEVPSGAIFWKTT